MPEVGASEPRTGLFGAAVTLTIASIINLLVNLFIQMRIAAYFGAGAEMDAYQTAMAIPQLLQGVLGVTLTVVLVPFFVTAFRRDESAGWRAAAVVINLTALAVLVSVPVAWGGGRALIRLVAPGPNVDRHLAARLFLVTLPAGALLVLQAILVSLCHARFRFLRPAVGTFLNGAFVVVFLLVARERLGIHALPLANAGGTALAVVVMGGLLAKPGRFRATLLARGTGLGRAALVGLPLVAAAIVYQSEPIVRTCVASYLPERSLSYLGFANRLLMGLQMATVTGLAGALFPFLARAADQADRSILKQRFAQGLMGMLYVTLPIAALAVPLAHPGIEGLLQRGAFTAEHTRAVGNLLWFYLPAYVAFSLGAVTCRVLYALKRTVAVSVLSVSAYGAFVVGLLVLVPYWKVHGIALARSAHAVAGLVLLCVVLHRVLGGLGGRAVWRSAWRLALAAAAAAGGTYAVYRTLDAFVGPVFLSVVVAGLVGAVLYLAINWFVLPVPGGDPLRSRLAQALRNKRT